MPTYEYVCTQCMENMEVQASISEKEKGLKVTCPKCGSRKTVQVFGSFAIGGSSGGFNPRSMPGCDPQAGPGCC